MWWPFRAKTRMMDGLNSSLRSRRMWLEASFTTAATGLIKLQGFELSLKSDMGTFSLSL
jgi:hypothetical protein